MTIKEAKVELAKVGITLRKVDDEFRVNFIDGKEGTAYYTDDLQDAVDTGEDMAKRRI